MHVSKEIEEKNIQNLQLHERLTERLAHTQNILSKPACVIFQPSSPA